MLFLIITLLLPYFQLYFYLYLSLIPIYQSLKIHHDNYISILISLLYYNILFLQNFFNNQFQVSFLFQYLFSFLTSFLQVCNNHYLLCIYPFLVLVKDDNHLVFHQVIYHQHQKLTYPLNVDHTHFQV